MFNNSLEHYSIDAKDMEVIQALTAPFQPSEISSRLIRNMACRYTSAREVMNRLDQVVGPQNWTAVYDVSETSVTTKLTITLPSGKQIIRHDAGSKSGPSEEGDQDKTGVSDSLKRAAMGAGIGRDLWNSDLPWYALKDQIQDQFMSMHKACNTVKKISVEELAELIFKEAMERKYLNSRVDDYSDMSFLYQLKVDSRGVVDNADSNKSTNALRYIGSIIYKKLSE